MKIRIPDFLKFSKSLIKILPILISLLGVVISLFQYSYNEYIKDIRKYNIEYYDEKYVMLKSTAQILSKINTHMVINTDGVQENDKDTLEHLAKRLNESIYYSYLFLNPQKELDSILLNDLDLCNSYLQSILVEIDEIDEEIKLSNTSFNAMINIGKILRNEKNEINTFRYYSFFDSF